MSSSSTETTIDLSGFTAHCHINDDGEHTTSCIDNLSCLRYKMARRVPLVWKTDRVDIDNIPSAQPVVTLDNARPIASFDNAQPIATLDNAQLHQELYHHPWGSSGPWAKQVTPRREPVPLSPPSREWQARTLADLWLPAPGFPIPGREKPASPVPEYPRPSTYWATSRRAPQPRECHAPQPPWSEWQIRTLADPRLRAPGFPIPGREPKKPASPVPEFPQPSSPLELLGNVAPGSPVESMAGSSDE